MTEINVDGVKIAAQDLSSVSPGQDDHDRLFNHDGSNPISIVGGGTTTEVGFYIWDDVNGAWHGLVGNVDTLDGFDSADFVKRQGDSMFGDLDLDGNLDLGGVLDLLGGDIVDGTTTLWDAANGRVPSSVVQGLDSHTSDTSNPHSVTAAQAGAIPDVTDAVSQSHLDFAAATQGDLDNHTAASNPHNITTTKIGAAPLDQIFLAEGTGTDINSSNTISWSNTVFNDPAYSFNGSNVTIQQSGVYEIVADADFQAGGTRRNPNIGVQRNGSWIGVIGRSGYVRNSDGHDHASVHTRAVDNLSSGDNIRIRCIQDANGETIVPDRSQFYIKKIYR